MKEKQYERQQNKTRNEDESNGRYKDLIIGRNCVAEALSSNRAIDTIMVASGNKGGPLAVLIAKAKAKDITIKEVDGKKLDYLSSGAVHQGVVALAAVKEYAKVEDIFELAKLREEPPFIIVLDGIEDPHNLGAIIRTAECAGAHGVIIPKRRSAGLSYTVGKASAGAVEYVPVARVTNISNCIDELKEKGVWVYGADMDGQPCAKTNLSGAVAIVVGGEGKGLGRLVKEKCDGILSLPMRGKINSLNASVATGILMYEIEKQRNT